MRKNLAVSLLLHAVILFWVVAVFPTARDDALEPQPLPVDVVTPSEVTKVKAGQPEAEKEQPAAQKKPEEPVRPKAKQETESKMKAVRVPEPTPKPSPEPAEPAPKKRAEKPTPSELEMRAEAAPAPPAPARKPKVAPKFTEPLKPERKVAAKTKPKDKNFDADRIAALLNKVPDAGARTPPAPERKLDPERPEPAKPLPGRSEGRDLQMSLSEIDALRARISQCWNPPVGGLGAQGLRVKLRLRLNPDGMLAERPEVVNNERSAFFQAAADSAVRAVMLCQPYSLPAEKYALWRDMILNFDPREMLGG